MKEMTLEAAVENIGVVTEFVESLLEAENCCAKTRAQVNIAVDELFGNIARYAYKPGSGAATVRVEVEREPRAAVVITFIDRGAPYDPLKSAVPDLSIPAQERAAGGLGIFVVKKSMDEIFYEYKDGQNVLKIKKLL